MVFHLGDHLAKNIGKVGGGSSAVVSTRPVLRLEMRLASIGSNDSNVQVAGRTG